MRPNRRPIVALPRKKTIGGAELGCHLLPTRRSACSAKGDSGGGVSGEKLGASNAPPWARMPKPSIICTSLAAAFGSVTSPQILGN